MSPMSPEWSVTYVSGSSPKFFAQQIARRDQCYLWLLRLDGVRRAHPEISNDPAIKPRPKQHSIAVRLGPGQQSNLEGDVAGVVVVHDDVYLLPFLRPLRAHGRDLTRKI